MSDDFAFIPQFCQALAGLAPCFYPADLFPSTRFYKEDIADQPVVVFDHERADGTGSVISIRVPDTPHTVAPIPRLLRREEGLNGSVLGEADGTGEMGRQLQKGIVKV